MTEEEERWAETLAIERLHGSGAPRWIADRIGALAREGDEAGIGRFRDIASRLDQLMRGTAH